MAISFKLNPITRKRIQRFCKIKRAYWSFWILIISFFLSLFANFFCNNHPLLVQFNNKYYFPILFDYKKSEFDPNSDNTIVDFKTLKKSTVFLENKNNFMVFPIIPFGPEENIKISEISISRDITIIIQQEPKLDLLILMKI